MENFLKWIEKVLEFIRDYGFINILKSWVIIICFSFTVAVLLFPTKTIETVYEITEKIQKREHERSEILGNEIYMNVEDALEECGRKFGCYEVLLLQGHNGRTNSDGVPYYFIESTGYYSYIENNRGQGLYRCDVHINMTKIDNVINDSSYFFGTSQEFYKVDGYLAERFIQNDVKYVVLIGVPSSKAHRDYIGYLILTFDEEYELNKKAISRLYETAKELGNLISI